MRICKRIATGEVIPDFQNRATPGTLIINAVRAGLGVAEEFEELEVTRDEFQVYVDAYIAEMQAAQ